MVPYCEQNTFDDNLRGQSPEQQEMVRAAFVLGMVGDEAPRAVLDVFANTDVIFELNICAPAPVWIKLTRTVRALVALSMNIILFLATLSFP